MKPEQSAEQEFAQSVKSDMEARTKAVQETGVLTEEQLRDASVPWPSSEAELLAYIRSLVNRPHDYGTSVYAMSMSALAAFRYAAHIIGTTRFQASCADMDFIKRTRNIKFGLHILDYTNLMYPQYLNDEEFPSLPVLLWKKRKELADEARKQLVRPHAHKDVIAWWQTLANEIGVQAQNVGEVAAILDAFTKTHL